MFCPSQAWDAHERSQELPETCPSCHGENAHENGEWVCPDEAPFCSRLCREAYVAEYNAEEEL